MMDCLAKSLHRLKGTAAVAGAVALLVGCGSGERLPANPAKPSPTRIADPGHPVSSEALAGDPTPPPPPTPRGCPRHPVEHPLTRPGWLNNVSITEYFPTPERWFVGKRVRAPGLSGLHKVDWLYSGSGVAMEGTGLGADGKHYEIDNTGSGTWINSSGRRTIPNACASHWSGGEPVWLAGGWRNRRGEVTVPLERGHWSNGPGASTRSYRGVTFIRKESPSIRPYHTVAVDPGLIPIGSRIYIAAYRPINGGWFVAGDTGGAIIGKHIDVYRPPTQMKDDGGRYLIGQPIYVIPPAR